MIPIPFASQSYQNRSLPVSTQRCLNLYPESVSESKNQLVLHGTPGLKTFSTGSGQVRGMEVMQGILYAVVGSTLYRVSEAGVLTSLGTVSGSGIVSMSNNGTQLTIVNGSQGYVYNGTFTRITDSDFSPADTCDFIDQYTVYNKNGTGGFFISALDDSSDINSLDFAYAMGSPDDTLAVLVDHREVWLFGESSIEVWYNSGNSSFPFERLAGAFIERGCGAKFSPAKLDNSVYWMGDDFAFYRADGYTPMRISTPAIEHAIQSYSVKHDAIAYSYSEEGHSFYQVTFPTANKTWVYDTSTQRWHERGNYTAGRHRSNCYAYAYDKHLVGDFENGTIWEMDLDTYTDGDDPIQRIAISPPIHSNNVDLFMSKLWVDVESGSGLTTGQGSDPQAMLNHSDDGGRTWSNERWTTLGKIGKYTTQAIWRRLGTFTVRVFKLTISDPVKVVIIGAYGKF